MTMDKKMFWNAAGKAGLVLGAVPAIIMAFSALATKLPPVACAAVDGVLWLVKFIGCIMLLRFFMKRFGMEVEDAASSDVFRFGVAVALLSGLVYSAFYLCYVSFINPEFFRESVETALGQYASVMDSNSLAAMEELIPRLPSLSFFANFLWCFIYGTALSAILCRYIKSDNPFSENN